MKIQENKSLKSHTTFMVDVSARYFAEINQPQDILKVLDTKQWYNNEHFILGQGSNTLFTKNYPGIILYNNIQGIKILDQDNESVWVEVGSGESWHDFVMWAVKKNDWGIENLVLVPGTVGGAPVQNIGAYGVEVSETIYNVYAIDIVSGKLKEFLANDCDFSYRNSFFKENNGEYFITKVTFCLSKKPQPRIDYGSISQELETQNINNPAIEDIASTIINIRESKLPKVGELGMAGSFFANPVISLKLFTKIKERFQHIKYFELESGEIKIPAGWIIEELGYKGIRRGDVGTYSKHALVIVNFGEATGSEVWNFAQEIIEQAYDVFGIDLDPEVNIL